MDASTGSDSSHDVRQEGSDRHLEACFVLSRASPSKDVAVTETASSSVKGSRSKRKIEFQDGDKAGKVHCGLPPIFKEEHPLYGKWRMEAFAFVWSRIEAIINDVLVEQNTHTFKEIERWIHNSFSANLQSKLHSSVEAKSATAMSSYPVVKQLATALVFIGNVEFVDDQSTFKVLVCYLKSHNCHVANLTPQELSSKSGIGGCVRSLLRQIVMITPDTPDIEILAAWHHEPANRKHPIAIIIEDVERCNCSVLAEFIIMLSEWVLHIPLVLVMGMATTVDALRKLLPTRAIQHLHSQRFNLTYPLERLEAVVIAVLIESFCGFDIGYNIAKFLYSFFLRQDGTVTSVLRALKIACMEHFCSEPLSFLCKELTQNASKEIWEDMCKALPKVMVKYAADLPSVKAHIKCEEEEIGMKLAAGLLDIKRRKQNWSTVLMCLYEAGRYTKIGFMDILCEALCVLSLSNANNLGQEKEDGKFYSTDTSRNAENHDNKGSDARKGRFIGLVIRKLRDLSLPSLVRLLQEWENLTKGMREVNNEVKTLQSMVESEFNGEGECNLAGIRVKCELRNKLPNMDGGLDNVSDGATTTCEDYNRDSTGMPPTAKTTGEKQLPRSTIHGRSTTWKRDSKAANEMAVNILERMVREFLVPIESMPFHEIICYKDVDALQLALIGDTRRTIQNDLLNSQLSLQCSCCKGAGLSSSMHETSLACHLAQEHGDVINVHDWYQSFGSIVSNPDLNSEHVEKQSSSQKKHRSMNELPKPDKASIQARFSKAIIELQIVGLLRMPSKRRPDYIQRVAFGS